MCLFLVVSIFGLPRLALSLAPSTDWSRDDVVTWRASQLADREISSACRRIRAIKIQI